MSQPGLFEGADAAPLPDEPAAGAPLAERMRPRTLDELVGQEKLVGPGRILRRLLEGDALQSLILWGPPGSGKTSLARLVAAQSDMRFVPFSAVLSGVKEIRAVMSAAEEERRRRGRRTLLFIDEIHRFNKAQQDAFLPFVERGDVVLIGATTENPSFEVNGALLSRVRTLVLEPLTLAQVVSLLERALADRERGLGGRYVATPAVLEAIAHGSDGDARRALGVLETAAALLPGGGEIDRATAEEALQRKTLLYDKAGEQHYDLISALHKSVRNSDPDAAIYWLARMLESGEDGNYLARRLIRMASEDVGLADPNALRAALDAADAYRRLGEPEGRLALAQAAAYLARAPKSNALYVALAAAEEDVARTAAEPVPLHLRNPVTELLRRAGYGAGYRYAHDDPDAAREMPCLPPSLAGRSYFPTSAPAPPRAHE